MATQFFAFNKMILLSPVFRKYLKVDVRCLDDKFGIWKSVQDAPVTYKDYKDRVNKVCKLNWKFGKLQDSGVHVDLFIWIDRPSKKVKWRHYAKPMNLDLLLGPNTAHAPGVHRSMILSRLETLFKHCSELQDYISEVDKFYQKLLNVGFNPSFLNQDFQRSSR